MGKTNAANENTHVECEGITLDMKIAHVIGKGITLPKLHEHDFLHVTSE